MEKSSQEIGLYGHHQQKSYFASLTVMKGSNIVKHESMLTVPRLGITDNWRKLYDKKIVTSAILLIVNFIVSGKV